MKGKKGDKGARKSGGGGGAAESSAQDEEAAVQAFAAANQSNALKTKPKASFN